MTSKYATLSGWVCFRQLITEEEAREAAALLDADLRTGRLARSTVRWPAVFRAASRVSSHHAAATGTRSVDVLHVAAARALRCKSLASFDARQRALGETTGLLNAF
jgi:predicted nucleic acid-binding protein